MIRLKICVLLLLSVETMPCAYSQGNSTSERWQERLDERGPKAILERGAAFYGYPGSMAFHSAFRRGITTRYLLLKTAAEHPALRNYLRLKEHQIEAISELRPVEVDRNRESHANALGDPNAEPDESVVNPDYFSFLSDDQLSWLDILALSLDGYPALARSSAAERLELSPMTRADVSRVLLENRTEILLPRFRANFAGRPPSDHAYRDAAFAGKFSAHLNHEIIDVLKPPEAERLTSWLNSGPPLDEAIKAIQGSAPLPGGLNSLAARWDPLRQ